VLKYLQIWLRSFYPARPDIVEQLKDDAFESRWSVGIFQFVLEICLIQKIFGWRVAKESQLVLGV